MFREGQEIIKGPFMFDDIDLINNNFSSVFLTLILAQ